MPLRPGPICELADGSPPPGGELRWPGFRWIILQRHGRRPLAVFGRSLLQADNRCAGLPWWSAVTIHETSTARFAAALCHTGPADEGPAWHDAWAHDSAETLRDALEHHDPLQALPVGLLPGSGCLMPPDAAAAWRFRAAWAGLLGAVFGLRPARQDARA